MDTSSKQSSSVGSGIYRMDNIPHECLDLILYYLPGKINQSILSLVCKKWKNAIKRIPRMILHIRYTLDNRKFLLLMLSQDDKVQDVIKDHEIAVFNITNTFPKKRKFNHLKFTVTKNAYYDKWDTWIDIIQSGIFNHPISSERFTIDDIKSLFDYAVGERDKPCHYYLKENRIFLSFIRAIKDMDIEFNVNAKGFMYSKKHNFNKVKLLFDVHEAERVFTPYYCDCKSKSRKTSLIVDMIPYFNDLPSDWIDTVRMSFINGDSPHVWMWIDISVDDILHLLKNMKQGGNIRFLEEVTINKITRNRKFSVKIMKLALEISPIQNRIIVLDLLIYLVQKKYIEEAKKLMAVNEFYVFTRQEVWDRVGVNVHRHMEVVFNAVIKFLDNN